MRRRWIYRDGQFVELDLEAPRPARKGPYVISDNMDYVLSHADGKRYTSKTKYRAELAARGFVEVGNERVDVRKPFEPVGVEQTIKEAIERAKSDV